jgi:uncharacterized protein YndB with AHSA1/START domain
MNEKNPTPSATSKPLVVRRTIDASAEELFDAWLDPEALAQWMLPKDVTATAAKVDPRVGGRYELLMTHSSGTVPHDGVYLALDRPRTLSFTWNSPYTHGIETRVTVEFLAAAGGTEVVLTHELLPEKEIAGHREGWTAAIAVLERFAGQRVAGAGTHR